MRQEWASFNGGVWQKEINVRDFIQKTIHLMREMNPFWQDLQRPQTIYGHRLWS